jgi:hypothetical protein
MVWTLLFERCDVIVAVKELHQQEGLMKKNGCFRCTERIMKGELCCVRSYGEDRC